MDDDAVIAGVIAKVWWNALFFDSGTTSHRAPLLRVYIKSYQLVSHSTFVSRELENVQHNGVGRLVLTMFSSNVKIVGVQSRLILDSTKLHYCTINNLPYGWVPFPIVQWMLKFKFVGVVQDCNFLWCTIVDVPLLYKFLNVECLASISV